MSDAQDAAHLAIADLLHTIDPGVMLASFILAAEVIDNTGKQSVWTLTPTDSTPWQALGLLEYAKAAEVACIHSGDDDDDP